MGLTTPLRRHKILGPRIIPPGACYKASGWFALGVGPKDNALNLRIKRPKNSCYLGLSTRFGVKNGTVSFKLLSQYKSVRLLLFDSSPHSLNAKPGLCLFNKTDTANGNALCPATFPLFFTIVDGLCEPIAGAAPKTARGLEIRDGSVNLTCQSLHTAQADSGFR